MNWAETKSELNRFLSKNKNFVFSIIIIGVIFLAFYKLLSCYFYQDDFGAFSWAMRAESDKSLVFARWTGYWRLGMNMFFILYNKLFGLNALPAYLFSILIQIFNALLVYIFVSILTKNKNIGLISSLLFAVGYMHGQTVSWLAPMTQGGFLGILWLISLLLFVHYLRRGDIKAYLCSLVAFFFSLMVKEAAVLLIPMLFLYDIMFSPQGRKVKIPTFFPRYLPFLAVVTIYKLFFMVSLPMGGQGAPAMQALHSGGFSSFIFTCTTILLSNMALLIIPTPIINEILPEFLWPFISVIFILLVIVVLLFTKRDKEYSRPVWYALFWTIINLTPYSLLWPVKGYEGGRYLFISSIGISIIITMLIYRGFVTLKRLLKPDTLALIISRCTFTVVIGSILLCNITLLHKHQNRYIKEGNRKREVIESLYSYYNKLPDDSLLYFEGDYLPFKELVIPGGILSVVYHNRGGDTLRKERNFATILSLLAQGKHSIDRLYAFNYDRDIGRLENKTEELRNILKDAQVLNYNFSKEKKRPTPAPWKASNPYQIRDGYLSTKSLEKRVYLKILSESLTLGINPIIYGPDEQLPAIIPYQIEIKMRISPRRLSESKFPYLRLSSHQPYFEVTSIPSVIDVSQLSHLYPDNFKQIITETIPFHVSVSSLYSNGEDSKYQAHHLNDGKYGSKYSWMAHSGVFPYWVKLDLGGERIVKGIIWSRDRSGQDNDRIPKDYNILISPDDINWIVAKVVKNNKFGSGEIKVDIFEPVKARYIKMEIYSTVTGNAPCLDEINVTEEKFLLDYEYYRKEDRLESILKYKNAQKEFRLHSIAYSSSDANTQCSVKNILDGKYDPENVWVPFYFVGESWIKIDFQDEKIINRVIWSRDRTGQKKDRIPIDYTIQTSLDDKDWNVVKTVQNDDFTTRGNYKVDDFEPIKARYVKMEITKIKDGFWAPAIDEFEVVEAKFDYIKDFNKLEEKFNDLFVFVSSCEEAKKIYDAIGIRGKAEISWVVSGGNDWDEKNSKEFEVMLDNKFNLYQIEINAGGLISNKIKQLRLNPLNIPGSVDINYIKIKPKISNMSK